MCFDNFMKIEIVVIKNEDEKSKALEIRREVFIDEQGVPEDIEIDDFESSSTHFLVYLDEFPVATGRFRIKKSYLKFERIATLKKSRGQGIGNKLMEFMQNFALKNFPEFLPAMHAQESAVSFYEKIGWIGVGDRYEEAGIIHQTMIYPPKKIDGLKVLEDPQTNPVILNILKSIKH